tara:strand:- start:1259 stop:2755 length:1497 start_codon:yes stop_codon:yes gene_type:complete
MNFDKQICKSLKSTYNTYILDGLSDEEFIKELCNKLYSHRGFLPKTVLNKINYSLLKLIYNKYYRNIPIFEKIIGPCSLTLYKSKKYKKSIYVFGESHCSKKDVSTFCNSSNYVTISDFLNFCSKNTPVFLDIFIEYPSASKHYGRAPIGMIGDIYIPEENGVCFNDAEIRSVDTTESCSTTRWHYTDIRFSRDYLQTSLAGHIYYNLPHTTKYLRKSKKIQWGKLDLSKINNLLKDNRYFEQLSRTRPSLTDLETILKVHKNRFNDLYALLESMGVTNFSDIDYKILMYVLYLHLRPDMLEFYELYATNNVKGLREWSYKQYFYSDEDRLLEKELDRSTEKGIITNFLDKKLIEKIYKNKARLSAISKNIMNSISKGSSQKDVENFVFLSVRDIKNILAEMGALFADSYTLARIFKKFKLKNIHDMPESPSNVITYAGELHAKNLGDFFENYIDSFERIGEVRNNACNRHEFYNTLDMCCLKLNGMPQPFFRKDLCS